MASSHLAVLACRDISLAASFDSNSFTCPPRHPNTMLTTWISSTTTNVYTYDSSRLSGIMKSLTRHGHKYLLFLISACMLATSSLLRLQETKPAGIDEVRRLTGTDMGNGSVQTGVWADIPLVLLALLLLILHFIKPSQMLVDRLPMPALALRNECGRRSRLHHCLDDGFALGLDINC